MSERTEIVTEPPAGTVKRPVEALKLNAVLLTPAESVIREAPWKRYTFASVESDDTPMRLNARFVTVIGEAVGFEKVNFPSSPIACPATRATLTGESAASMTLRPLPVIGTPGTPGTPGTVPAQSWLAFAREDGPQYPEPAVRPTGAKMLDAYLFWNLTTAAFVKPPK